FKIIPGRFAICQLPAGSPVAAWATATLKTGGFSSVTASPEELSIVCEESAVAEGTKSQKDFVCFQLAGPFPLDSVGILREFLEPLSAAGVPIFAVSTFNTDFVLVPEAKKALALKALRQAGHDLLT
ncbi:MAG: ACT domain-containing protein, partial [Terriglobales bacterium]